jgi:hypothetical protein
MFKNWLREFLGINTIQKQINELHQAIDNTHKATTIENRNSYLSLQTEIRIIQLAHARIIAKIDPAFNMDMCSPEAKAQSEAIGKQVLAKIIAEHKISGRYGA